MNVCRQNRWRLLQSRQVTVRVIGLLVLAYAVAPPPATAQVRGQTATVTTAAPVFLLPDASRTPLRTLPAGTSVTVVQAKDEWIQVTFNDPQFGRRTGWIQQRFLKLGSQPTEPAPIPTPKIDPRTGRPPAQPPRPARRREGIGARGVGTVTFDKLLATESFKAVTGSDTTPSFGGGVQVTNLWRGLFAEASVETTSLDGERVFVGPNDEIFRLGIPIEIRMTPIDVVVGWRTLPVERVISYAAAGATFLSYDETSDFADAAENVTKSHTGFMLLGGVEYQAARFVHVRGEIRYRSIRDALGAGGVSAHFDETELGGFGAALKIAVGR